MKLLRENLIKSPLRYPGGKSRAVKTLFKYIPVGTKTLCSPFFGGGSLEIYCAQKGIRVFGYDSFGSLLDFWQKLLENPQKLADAVTEYQPGKFSKIKFEKLQRSHPSTTDSFKKAVEFYVLNRTSFSGSTLLGGMARVKEDIEAKIKEDINPRFTESSINRIRNFRIDNLSVKHMDFKDSINKHKKDLLYLDPPYIVESKLYGNRGDLHKGFDHEGLAKILRKRKNWILSYNESETIKEMYKGFQFEYPEWAYGMKNVNSNIMGKSQEILILSNDLSIPKKINQN